MKAVGQRLIDVPPKVYKKLYNLNMRQAGEMQKTLRELRQLKDKNVFIHYILKDEKLLGWTMAVKVKCWYGTLEGYFNHFYVRKNERKNKYGEALLRAANLYCVRKEKKCIVSAWDARSATFFSNTAKKYGLELVYRDVLSFNWKNI